jgi:hypothetical protein
MTRQPALVLIGALWLTGCAEVEGRPDLSEFCRQEAREATFSHPYLMATPAYGLGDTYVVHSGIGAGSLLVGVLAYQNCLEQIAATQQGVGAQP